MSSNTMSPADMRQLAKMVADELFEQMAGSPRLVDGLELAEICGVSLATIERAKAAGEIPYVQFGARIKYSPADVIAARAKNAQRPTADEQTESPAPASDSTELPQQLTALERVRQRSRLQKTR